MMNRIAHNNIAEAIALEKAAALRHAQAAAQTTQQSGAQYDFAALFGGGIAAATAANPSTTSATHTKSSFDTAIAAATANVIKEDTGERLPATIAATTGTTAKSTTAASTNTATGEETTDTVVTSTAATQAAATATATTASTTTTTTTTPGVEALVDAIMNGSFQATYVTDPSQLQETTPMGSDTMPSSQYASDQTAAQLAQLLGGTVVQRPAFGQVEGWNEPLANFIQLPNGQTFNAADLAYYANCGDEGAPQLTADITSTINEGSAWTNYYQYGGSMPVFPEGYVGPPISGMTYSASMIGADGNVINPAV